MIADDIIKRVQSKLDDPDGTYIVPEYVLGHAQNAYESLYNELKASGFQFDEETVVLAGVPAGVPNLDAYMAAGSPLEMLVRPRLVEWRLPGQADNRWRVANGPLEAVHDMPAGIQRLDSWAWIRRSVKLSSFAVKLDLRITGQFLFPPLTADDSPVGIDITVGPALTLALVLSIAKARGNDKWVTTYSADYINEVDNLFIAMTKAMQAMPFRVARCSRRNSNSSPTSSN